MKYFAVVLTSLTLVACGGGGDAPAPPTGPVTSTLIAVDLQTYNTGFRLVTDPSNAHHYVFKQN